MPARWCRWLWGLAWSPRSRGARRAVAGQRVAALSPGGSVVHSRCSKVRRPRPGPAVQGEGVIGVQRGTTGPLRRAVVSVRVAVTVAVNQVLCRGSTGVAVDESPGQRHAIVGHSACWP